MADFPQTVAIPPTSAYGPGLADFSPIANAPNTYYQGQFNKQQQQLNQQSIEQGQQKLDVAGTFKNGLPVDPQTGQIDYKKAVAMLAQKGDINSLWNGADAMLTQSATNQSPMLTGGSQPGAGGAAGAGGAPASVPARPLPAPAANAPQGDSGSGTVASLVMDRMPGQDTTTGATIGKIAQVMGVDPNAQLTPGQQRRAQGLLQRYAPGDKTASADSGAAPSSFADRLAASGDQRGSLPPSANAVAPAPKPSPPQPRAPIGAGAPQPQAGPPAAPMQPQRGGPGGPGGATAAPMQPQQPQGGPITPQVPLPKGFTDPQQAILALRAEAGRLSANPRAKGQVDQLTNWAERIEESIKPVTVGPNATLLDPRTGQPLYQGAAQNPLQGAALDAAAERYLQSGQFPPNTGRGVQGTADRNAILNHASALADAKGIDQADLPGKWQQFKGQQVAIQRFTSGPQGNTVRSFNVLVDHLDTLREAGAALKNGDIRLFNRWKQNYATQTGESAPTSFDGVKALVGDEIVKAVVGSAGALADREEVKKDLDKASSPKQLADLIDKYDKLALGQLKGLRKQYEVSTGQKNFGDMLLPGTLSALGGNAGKGSAPDAQGWVTLPNGARIQEEK
jgi:hypothetical protein